MAPDEVAQLLEAHGLPVAEWRLAATPREAGEAAAELGCPVAVKAVAVKPGKELVEGPYVAESFPVRVENSYVVVEA